MEPKDKKPRVSRRTYCVQKMLADAVAPGVDPWQVYAGPHASQSEAASHIAKATEPGKYRVMCHWPAVSIAEETRLVRTAEPASE